MKLLLVEDNAELARWVVNLMQVENFAVDWAPDGEHAGTLLSTQRYDAVLLDMRLPGIMERDRTMHQMVTAAGASYVSVYDSVCHNGVCDEFALGDIPLQFDAGHLTVEGSVKVAQRLSAFFKVTVGANHAAN